MERQSNTKDCCTARRQSNVFFLMLLLCDVHFYYNQLVQAYCVYVWSLLEYCSAVWSPLSSSQASDFIEFVRYCLCLTIVVPVLTLKVFARDSTYAKRAYAIAIPSVCPSVRPSVRHTGGSVKNG